MCIARLSYYIDYSYHVYLPGVFVLMMVFFVEGRNV